MFETFLQKYSIEVVINRTKISRRNLEKLKNGDFEGLTRPQVMGFIKILEREFDEDFTPLKEGVETFFKTSAIANEPIFQPSSNPPTGGMSRWVVVGIVCLVVGAAYYLYEKDFVSSTSSSGERMVKMHSKKQEMANDQKRDRTVALSYPSSARHETIEKNSSSSVENSTSVKPKPSKTMESPTTPYVPIEPVMIDPTIKLWLGIIDLKSGKRVAKVVGDPFEIDSRGQKIVVTGHGRFEISDAFGNLFKYDDAEKHYFLVDDGLVKELSNKEFRKLNGGKGW